MNQIAAALVNEKFEIVETLNETCKLKDGIVPHPQALLINKIKIDTLKNGQSFFEMVNKVHRKFTDWSPAIFIGYNSLFFDEVVLRQSLYQSLYDPYLTNTNDNRRADLYHIMCAITKLRPDIIKHGKFLLLKDSTAMMKNGVKHIITTTISILFRTRMILSESWHTTM